MTNEIKEYLAPYTNHLPTCNKVKDWFETDDALAHTPIELRDEHYYAAIEEINKLRSTCTCGLDKVLSPATPQPVTGEAGNKSKSKRITLCGSTKFKAEFEAINRQLTLEGNVVYSVCAFGHKDNIKWTDQQKELLDEVHKRKIDNSDGIFVINVDDYIGESTRSEIEYAEHTGKFVKYLSDFPDLKYISDAAMIRSASRQSDAVEEIIRLKRLLIKKCYYEWKDEPGGHTLEEFRESFIMYHKLRISDNKQPTP